MLGSRRSFSLYRTVFWLITVSGLVVILFDIAKKSIFLGASWNYDYPPRTLQYNVLATVLTVVLSVAVIALYRKYEQLSPQRFVGAVAVTGGVLYGLSFFVLPGQTAYHALTPGKGMYCASVTLTDDGVLYYFSNFHKVGLCEHQLGVSQSDENAEYFRAGSRQAQMLLLNTEWLPWHQQWAEYASQIQTQKHGPIPPLIAGLFMIVFGKNIATAVAGNYLMAALIPAVGYGLFKTRFSDELSRFGALSLMFSPALFFYARNHTVAYDMYTAFFLIFCMYFIMVAIDSNRTIPVLGAGFMFSLAILSKVTATLFGLSVLLLFIVGYDERVETVRRLFEFGISSLALPVLLLAVGYNFVIQYLFQYGLNRISVANKDTGLLVLQKPNPDLGNPLLNFFARTYHLRLIGYVFLLLAAVGIVLYATRRYELNERATYVCGFLLSLPVLFFLLTMYGLNLARQLLPYYGGIWFIGLAGLTEVLDGEPRRKRYVLYVTTLVLLAGTAIVNI